MRAAVLAKPELRRKARPQLGAKKGRAGWQVQEHRGGSGQDLRSGRESGRRESPGPGGSGTEGCRC